MEESTYFSDIKWVLQNGKNSNLTKANEMTHKILLSKNVKNVIKKQGSDSYSRANSICKTISADFNKLTLMAFSWFLHKTFRIIYDKVLINFLYLFF